MTLRQWCPECGTFMDPALSAAPIEVCYVCGSDMDDGFCSDSSHGAGVSGGADPLKGAPLGAAIAGVSDSSDSSHGAGVSAVTRRRWHRSGPYKSHGQVYYRYQWGYGAVVEGTKHIPGGNCRNPTVQHRAYRVYQAIHVERWAHKDVLAMIDGWRSGRRSRG
jgi:hypothetical protein